jgi:CxC5 like cysteine cluster associated with KDZ transposases/CxC6 like cysteine cluster associated with KDZ transposases
MLAFLTMIHAFGLLPTVMASSQDQTPFPDIPFHVFVNYVEKNFSTKVSLATVLTVLFTLTSNPDLLNLHARQQKRQFVEEQSQQITGWLKALTYALKNKLGDAADSLLQRSEQSSQLSHDHTITAISTKLNALSKLLKLTPYDEDGTLVAPLKPVSEKSIEPVLLICPIAMECETSTCNPRSLLQNTRNRDIPRVTLIKDAKIYQDVLVLSGKCPKCHTTYYADHESAMVAQSQNSWNRYYLNSAKYIKIGSQLWVDRFFSSAVLNGMYSFHASAAAFAEFWNDSFWAIQNVTCRKVTRRQIWHAFVQESIRQVAAFNKYTLELPEGLAIAKVTKHAFEILGEEGIIRNADGHSCSECTHPYRSATTRIANNDPAALLGVDENHIVPALEGEDADLAVQDAAQARADAHNAMDVVGGDDNKAPVKLVVMDGQVMGPRHCAYDNCTADLSNARLGVFCIEHELLRGHLCRMRNCENPKATGIHTCAQHINRWNSHVTRYGRQSALGVSRIIRRTEEERLPWLPTHNQEFQPHDEPGHGEETPKDNYFRAPRFYCVETICAPCGVVIAWTKFAKAESPTNILDFLKSVYPSPNLRPDYICIDKACAVLRTAIANGTWNTWKDTTRFIVDSYHYINHRTTDYLCRTWCNPAPLNGSQPNLVAVEQDRNGQLHYKRAFNTQVNEWLVTFLL